MARSMSKEMWEQLNTSRQMQGALVAVGKKVQQRAQQITNAEGGDAEITLDVARRPRGRLRVNVVSNSPEEEYGSEKQTRIRALGRAAREV